MAKKIADMRRIPVAATPFAGKGLALDNTGKIPPELLTNGVPTGCLTMYVSSTAPTGWMICDGTEISRTTYAALFAVISILYGAGDGSTTFNIPDLRGRVPVGKGTNASVAGLGVSEGLAVGSRRPQHRTTDAKTVSAGSLAGTIGSLAGTVGTLAGTIGSLGASHTLTLPDHQHAEGVATAGGSSLGPQGVITNNTLSQFGVQVTDNPSTHPAINGSVSLSGTPGLSGSPSLSGAPGISGSPTLGGFIGTNNANDALDVPAHMVISYIIKI